MNRMTTNIDFKIIFKLIIGSIFSILSGIFFKEAYVMPLVKEGQGLDQIPTFSIFFWTFIGVVIGFVIGFFIIAYLIDLVAAVLNTSKSWLYGIIYKKSYVIDSSALLDGRIAELVRLGLFPSHFFISSITIDELNRLEKVSSVYAKRVEKAKAILSKLHKVAGKRIHFMPFVDPPKSIRDHILKIARLTNSTILTLDVSITDEARRNAIRVININELALAFRVQMIPGETFALKLVRAGKEKNQAVGYLEDGMMVIVEGGIKHIHKTVEAECVSVLQSTSGKIVFSNFVREIRD